MNIAHHFVHEQADSFSQQPPGFFRLAMYCLPGLTNTIMLCLSTFIINALVIGISNSSIMFLWQTAPCFSQNLK